MSHLCFEQSFDYSASHSYDITKQWVDKNLTLPHIRLHHHTFCN